MKFGMLNFYEQPAGGKTEHQIIKEQLECMRAAEDLGFDYIWAPEHHSTEYGYSASPMLTLAAIASVTKRIRLGSGVVVLPFNDPIRVAEEGAMLDLISDGRFELGLGRGFQPVEYRSFGVDQARSRQIFDEAVQLILQAWTQEAVKFKGAHFDVTDRPVRPKPLQKPYPPIWMAAIGDESFRSAGKQGFNLLCSMVYGFKSEAAAELIRLYRGALKAYEHGQGQVGALCMVYCAETTERARQDFGGPALWYYRTIANYVAPRPGEPTVEGYEPYVYTRSAARTVQWDELLERGAVICGNPEECVNQIEEMQKNYGFDQILCWTRLAGLEHRKVLRSMELLQRDVIPHFRK
jgi:luciferase family oxidoreductase group 1